MKPKRTKQVAGIIVGSLLLVVSPIIAFLLNAFGMLHAFDTLSADNLDPNRLNGDMNVVLYSWVAGAVGFVIGLIILIVSIVLFVRADRAVQTS